MDAIFVPSRSTFQELVAKGIAPEKIKLFPRGIDTVRFHPTKRSAILDKEVSPSKALRLLYVGRISREKNLPVLERAFKSLVSRLKDPSSVHLVVVVDGPYLAEMKQHLRGLPCTFTGYQQGEALPAIYASCDLFVFPSTTDTFGNVVLEAQASGLPVVVTDKGGPCENMLPGETGLVVPPDDPDSIVEAILALMHDPIRSRQMGRAARRYMENRSFETAFAETWGLYGGDTPEPESPFARAV
jgi:glycosyltransferase involved in cell wall biosynthesis